MKSTTCHLLKSIVIVMFSLVLVQKSAAQYVGVTCGWNYSNPDDTGAPDTGTTNTPLYNPQTQTNMTWVEWIDEMGQAGVDFVCPNCRGSQPETKMNPTNLINQGFLTALDNSGFSNQIKVALFDDNAYSWQAQWDIANGNSTLAFNIGDTNNWKYIYDYNYKPFFQAIPNANLFKINGRPVIIIWTGNEATVTNEQGNYSRAMTYVRQGCQNDFGFNPFIIVNTDALKNDTTLLSVVDAAHNWTGTSGTWSFIYTNGYKIGCALPSQPGLYALTNSAHVNAEHGQTFKTALSSTVGAGALLTLIEGFSDWEENCSVFRVRNQDTSGNSLDYNQTYYDYPNERLDIVRQYSQNPFLGNLKFQGDGCDFYGSANGGNGQTNYFRNGNIAIQTTTDTNGGWNVGWINSGEWLEWTNVPLNSHPHFLMRIASPNSGVKAHFVIDGVTESSQTLPNTGGWETWQTYDFGAYGYYTNSYHDVRIVFDNGGENFNWWQL